MQGIIDNLWAWTFALGIFCMALGGAVTILIVWFNEWRKEPVKRRKPYVFFKYWCPDCGYIFHVPERVDEQFAEGCETCPHCKSIDLTLEDENVEVWV